jgi:site-specific DNA-adenine methylase
MKRLLPFFSYFGSKHRIASRYPAPIYSRVVESFAGSAAYACLYFRLDIILVEANPKIAGAWEYLIRTPSAEVRNLPLLEAGQKIEDLAGAPQEARWLIGLCAARGRAHPAVKQSAWMESGEHPNHFWGEAIRARIASQVDRIRHWRVVVGDYRETNPGRPATYFVDPPYQGKAGRQYRRYGSDSLDYSALAEWCRTRDGQVIVCENAGADWLPFRDFHVARGTNGKNRTGVSKEAIWTAGNHMEQCTFF